jgi:hypothetical protein
MNEIWSQYGALIWVGGIVLVAMVVVKLKGKDKD